MEIPKGDLIDQVAAYQEKIDKLNKKETALTGLLAVGIILILTGGIVAESSQGISSLRFTIPGFIGFFGSSIGIEINHKRKTKAKGQLEKAERNEIYLGTDFP